MTGSCDSVLSKGHLHAPAALFSKKWATHNHWLGGWTGRSGCGSEKCDYLTTLS